MRCQPTIQLPAGRGQHRVIIDFEISQTIDSAENPQVRYNLLMELLIVMIWLSLLKLLRSRKKQHDKQTDNSKRKYATEYNYLVRPSGVRNSLCFFGKSNPAPPGRVQETISGSKGVFAILGAENPSTWKLYLTRLLTVF